MADIQPGIIVVKFFGWYPEGIQRQNERYPAVSRMLQNASKIGEKMGGAVGFEPTTR
jgi:hypothetical protein